MGKHVLVAGLGRIGQRVAFLCQAFGMQVSAYESVRRAEPGCRRYDGQGLQGAAAADRFS